MTTKGNSYIKQSVFNCLSKQSALDPMLESNPPLMKTSHQSMQSVALHSLISKTFSKELIEFTGSSPRE